MKDKTYEIARNRKYNGYQRALTSIAYRIFVKKIRFGVSVSEQLAEKLHNPILTKIKRRKVYARFKDNIWAADLVELESFCSKNKNVKYLLFVIDIFTKYAWVEPLKDKTGRTVLNALIEIVNESNRKPNKLWVDLWREFLNELMQKWLNNNEILMFSTHNDGKSVIAKNFMKTLKAKSIRKWQLVVANLILVISIISRSRQ